MKRKSFILMIAAMLLTPMSMMAQTVVTDPDTGLKYLTDATDTSDKTQWYVYVFGNSEPLGNLQIEGKNAHEYFFPHSNFRIYIRNQFSAGTTGKISYTALQGKTTFTSNYTNGDLDRLVTFQGIEYLPNITAFTLNSGSATSVECDFSRNPNLATLTFSNANIKITKLDISNTKLTSVTIPTESRATLKNLAADNTAITGLNLTGCNALETLSLNGCTSLTSLTLPAAGNLRSLDISNTENSLSDNYSTSSPWDLSSYGLELKYANTGFVLNDNLILYSPTSTRITLDVTGTSAEGTNMDFSAYSNLVYLKINGASGVSIPSGRTTFELDLWDSPETTIDWNDQTTLTTLKLNNVKTFDGTELLALTSLTHTGPNSENLILTKDHTDLTFLDISYSGIKFIDFSGGDDAATAEPIAPNLVTFRALFSALEEVDLSWHTSLKSNSVFTHTNVNPNNEEGFWVTAIPKSMANKGWANTITDIDAYNASNHLRIVKLRGCTGMDGGLYLNVGFTKSDPDENFLYYNNIEEVDVSGCVNLGGFYCTNSFMTRLNMENCTKLDRLQIDQGMLTGLPIPGGNGERDINLKYCTSLKTFIAKRNKWETLDFLLVPSPDSGRRTAEEIGKMRNIQVNGGSYTLRTSEDNVADRKSYARKDKDGNELLYTCRLREVNLNYLTCWDGIADTEEHPGIQVLLLDCNLLTELDLSKVGPGLRQLECTNNMLTTLDLSSLDPSILSTKNWTYQVGWLPAEIVKGHWDGANDKWMDTKGNYDWVALNMVNGGYTHRMDNDFGLYRNLYDARYNNDQGRDTLAKESKPWMCKVSEVKKIVDEQLDGYENFIGSYPCPSGHTGQHIFLHSQAEITKDFGAYKDQDLTNCVLTYKYNTGYRQTRTSNEISPDDTDNYSFTGIESLTPAQQEEAHIIVRMHLFPYLLNVNPVSKNEFSASELSSYGQKNVDYYSSTLILDYDALIPDGVSVYTISGIKERSVFEVRGKGVDGQLDAVLFGGDGHPNKILPKNTPVYVRVNVQKVGESKVEQPAGLYAFQPIREVKALGWQNLRGEYDQDDYTLIGMESLNDGDLKPEYIEAYEAALDTLANETHSKNVLRGYIAPKHGVHDDTHINDENFNRYINGTTTDVEKLTVLTLGIQNQTSAWPVIGFWPYRGTTLSTNRCYIPYEEIYSEGTPSGGAKGFNFFFVNEEKDVVDVTGVKEISDKWLNAAEGWYNMQGVRLNSEPTQQGVYIRNGKKVTIK